MLTMLEHINFLKKLVALLTIMLSVFGLSSHYYIPRHDKYYASNGLLVYSTFVVIAFAIVYLNNIYNDYLEGFDLSNVSKLYSYINIIAALLSYITGIVLRKHMPEFMNRAKVSETIDFFEITKEMLNVPMLLVVLKAILFPVATEIALVIHQSRNATEGPVFNTLFTLYPTVIAQIMPNCVFGVFELWKVYMTALNKRLRDICNHVNYMQQEEQMQLQKPYYRMQSFCDLADKLDKLSEKYIVIGYQVLEYTHMYAVPYVCALVCNLFGITMGCYIQYSAIADSLINCDYFDVFNSISNGMFLIISIGEIIFLANSSNDNVKILRETGLILQNIDLKHADVRFKLSVETFTLLAYSNKFNIKPLGLFEINISIIHDISGTVTSFLLILIQSDLTLRFSLK